MPDTQRYGAHSAIGPPLDISFFVGFIKLHISSECCSNRFEESPARDEIS